MLEFVCRHFSIVFNLHGILEIGMMYCVASLLFEPVTIGWILRKHVPWRVVFEEDMGVTQHVLESADAVYISREYFPGIDRR